MRSVGAWKKLGNKIVPFSIEMTASELSIHNVVKKIDDIVVKKNGLEPKDVIIEIHERYLADMTTVLEMAIEKPVRKGLQCSYKQIWNRPHGYPLYQKVKCNGNQIPRRVFSRIHDIGERVHYIK